MQHLLTEDELRNLQGRPTHEAWTVAINAIEALRKLVVSNTGCIHSEGKRLWYCDECPIGRAALGMDGNSHDHKAHEVWSMACGQSREYSK